MAKIPFIPRYIPNTRPSAKTCIRYLRIQQDGSYQENMDPLDFARLTYNAPDASSHVYPDLEAGLVYYFDAPSETEKQLNVCACRAFALEQKRNQRSMQCTHMSQHGCSGGHCEACPYFQVRETSLETMLEDLDGNCDPQMEKLPGNEPTPVTIVEQAEMLDSLRAKLAALSDSDRRLLLASKQEGVTYDRLAAEFGLYDRSSARKRVKHLEEKLRKEFL